MPEGMPLEQPSPMPMGAPQGAPMGMPAPKQGLQAKSRIEIQQAIQVLKQNLNPEVFEVHGQEWKALDSAIKGLSKVIGEEEGKDLSNAGLKMFAGAQGMPKGLQGLMGALGGGQQQQGQGMPMGGPQPMNMGGM